MTRICFSNSRCGLALVAHRPHASACGYNTIPTLEEQAKARWADVQNQYQRRADLIPNLVATVQGYAAQEKNVLTAVVEARAKATQIKVDASHLTDPDKLKAFQDAQNQLTGALGRLLAVTENYPDLKSNANFLALQSQLEGTENRIAVARRDYIEAVRAYNTALRTFPTVLWAKTAFSGEQADGGIHGDRRRGKAAAGEILMPSSLRARRASIQSVWMLVADRRSRARRGSGRCVLLPSLALPRIGSLRARFPAAHRPRGRSGGRHDGGRAAATSRPSSKDARRQIRHPARRRHGEIAAGQRHRDLRQSSCSASGSSAKPRRTTACCSWSRRPSTRCASRSATASKAR